MALNTIPHLVLREAKLRKALGIPDPAPGNTVRIDRPCILVGCLDTREVSMWPLIPDDEQAHSRGTFTQRGNDGKEDA